MIRTFMLPRNTAVRHCAVGCTASEQGLNLAKVILLASVQGGASAAKDDGESI
jgi:hypothetical protein